MQASVTWQRMWMGWERSRTDNFTHYQCFYLCHSLCAPPSTCSFSTDLRASTLPRHNCHLQTQLIYRPLFSLKCENLQGSELTLALDKSPDCEGPSHLRVFPDESTSTQRRHLQTVGESPCQGEILIGPAEVLGSNIRQEQEGHTALPELDPLPRNI